MRKVIVFVLILISISCSPDRTTFALEEDEQKLLRQFQELDSKHKLKISEDSEPGAKLKLCLTIVDKETKQKLVNQRIHFFHTSTEGEYQPKVADDDSTARLNGDATTDSQGRVFVETILPGDYGSSANNRHIHTTIFGAKPEGYDINFKQYASFMSKNFIESSDQNFLADLKKDDDGTLVAFLTLEPKNVGK